MTEMEYPLDASITHAYNQLVQPHPLAQSMDQAIFNPAASLDLTESVLFRELLESRVVDSRAVQVGDFLEVVEAPLGRLKIASMRVAGDGRVLLRTEVFELPPEPIAPTATDPLAQRKSEIRRVHLDLVLKAPGRISVLRPFRPEH